MSKQNIVVIHHRTNGHGDYEKCPVIERTIKAWYSDGRCIDVCGDVWEVRSGADNKWHTVS